MSKKIAIVLSGGGARGIAHLGFLKALFEIGVKPTIYSGTSAGAIVAGFMANNYSPEETFEIITKTNLLKYVKFSFDGGVFSMKNVATIYKKYFTHHTFETLPTPIKVCATDIHTGKAECFNKGDIISPIMASSSVPTLFEPVVINGKRYIDGGVVNNFPVEFVENEKALIFGQYVNPWVEKHGKISTKELIERTFHLAIYSSNKARMEKCNYVQEPKKLAKFSMYDIANAKEMFDIGYQETIKYASKIEQKLHFNELH